MDHFLSQLIDSVVFFSVFIFPHKMKDFLEGTLSEELIRNYRDDLDFQNLIDLLQKVKPELKICIF